MVGAMSERVDGRGQGLDFFAVVFLEVGEILLACEVVLLPFGHLINEKFRLGCLLIYHLHQLNNLSRRKGTMLLKDSRMRSTKSRMILHFLSIGC